MRPDPKSRISLIVARLGLRIGTGTPRDEPAIAWDTGTWFDTAAHDRLGPGAINRECVDISKSAVDRAWASVSGYSVEVDPLTFDGLMVIKSELNGRHDGRMVEGPTRATRPGFVYQRFVDAVEDGQLIDWRTIVVGSEIVVLMRRAHSARRWFTPATSSPFADAAVEFSAEERAQILGFSALLGLEYGELDVLRDRESGRIYVLDANRTPQGPADSETAEATERATHALADAFSRLINARWP